MSTAYISPYKGLDDSKPSQASGRTAQVFQGDCSADVAVLTLSTAFPADASPQFTVGGLTGYVVVYLTAPGQIYAGPTASDKTARGGYFPAGWWPMAVQPGDVVFIRDLA